MRPQPFSDIPAKQRAFSLKQSYMTYVLNNYIFGTKTDEHIVKNPALLRAGGFEAYILRKVRPYIGKTQAELASMFGVTTKAKNVNELLLAKMLGIEGKITATDEFQKANIVPKTIRVNHDGSITESMSFPAFDFKAVAAGTWEDSDLKVMFEETKFLFVVFRFDQYGRLIFDDLVFWNIPNQESSSERLANGPSTIFQRPARIGYHMSGLTQKTLRIHVSFPMDVICPSSASG